MRSYLPLLKQNPDVSVGICVIVSLAWRRNPMWFESDLCERCFIHLYTILTVYKWLFFTQNLAEILLMWLHCKIVSFSFVYSATQRQCISVCLQRVVLMPVLEALRYQWVAVDVRELEFQSSNWLCFPAAGCIQPGPEPLPTAPSLFVWRHCSCLHLSLLIRPFILFALITAWRVTLIHCGPFNSIHHTLGPLWAWNACVCVCVIALSVLLAF